jgi:hypothetical protein
MRKIQELHEEIDEVNYFLREWQRLRYSDNPYDKIVRKPEILFVSHSLERVVSTAKSLQIPLVLKTGKEPVLARRAQRTLHPNHKPNFNFLIPSQSIIRLTNFRKLKTKKGDTRSFVGDDRGLLTLRCLAETVYKGGELLIVGNHAGDWSA